MIRLPIDVWKPTFRQGTTISRPSLISPDLFLFLDRPWGGFTSCWTIHSSIEQFMWHEIPETREQTRTVAHHLFSPTLSHSRGLIGWYSLLMYLHWWLNRRATEYDWRLQTRVLPGNRFNTSERDHLNDIYVNVHLKHNIFSLSASHLQFDVLARQAVPSISLQHSIT